MAVNCGPSFGLCAVRITRIDANGNVIAGNNAYVTDQQLSVAVTVNKETGNSFSARNGCGCSISRFKAPDIFNWFEFSFVDNALEPEMIAFMIGADTISDSGDVVGVNFPGALDCSDDEPAVAFEFWTQHLFGSAQDGTFPWYHWVFPRTIWSLGDSDFAEDYSKPTLTGFSRTNTNWGDGPYGDGPPDGTDITEGGQWMTDVDPPSASCEAVAVTSTS